MEIFVLTKIMCFRVNTGCTPTLDGIKHTRDVGGYIIVVIDDLDLKAFIVIGLLIGRWRMLDPQDIFLMHLNIFLFVHHILDDICMTDVCLIQIRLQVVEQWGATSMRFLMILKVVMPGLRSAQG